MSSSLASHVGREASSAPVPGPAAAAPASESPSTIGVRRKGRGFDSEHFHMDVSGSDSSSMQGTELMGRVLTAMLGVPAKRSRIERGPQPPATSSTDPATQALEPKISDTTAQIAEHEEVLDEAERRYSLALLAQTSAQRVLKEANQRVQEEDRVLKAAKLQRDALRFEKIKHERLLAERVQLAKRMKEIDEAVDGQQDGAVRSG